MVIFLNMDGSCENVSPQHVYQGSNNVTDVTVVAPYAASTAMQIGFILPNGLYWQSESDGARYMPMEFMRLEEQYRLGVWRYVLPQSVTERHGELRIAINAITDEGNRTSYMCTQLIQESVVPNYEPVLEPTVFDLLQQYIARLDGRTADVPYLVRGIQKVAGNAFTFTNNSGVESEPIVLTGEDAPIPVNTGSKVVISSDSWQPSYQGSPPSITRYTYTVSAAMHGQMRDGASANDLWVSFDVSDSAGYSVYNPTYHIDYQGNIFISMAIKPAGAVTVRVWNGKGIEGKAATVKVAEKVEKLPYTESPRVINEGDETAAILKFEIPQGKPAFVSVGEVYTLPPGSNARVEMRGTQNDPIFDFYLPEGVGFTIYKTYSSIEEMNAEFATDNVPLYGFVIIDTGDVEDADNAKLYIKNPTGYEFLTDLSGAQGIKGETGKAATVSVGTVKTVAYGMDATVKNSGTDSDAVLDFELPQGEPGYQIDGVYRIYVDSDNNIWCEYTDAGNGEKPQFEYNRQTGDLYYKLGEGRTLVGNIPKPIVSNTVSENETNAVSGAAVYKYVQKAISGLSARTTSGSPFNDIY